MGSLLEVVCVAVPDVQGRRGCTLWARAMTEPVGGGGWRASWGICILFLGVGAGRVSNELVSRAIDYKYSPPKERYPLPATGPLAATPQTGG